eukprot:Hpha_TRINITY_DN16850_c1_g4::TRINITY_DN16850_c1_g4_i2::g.152975::m.152975
MYRVASLLALVGTAASCKFDEYCCPDALHCLKPTLTSCSSDASVCGDKETCCPLTKLCVSVGIPCKPTCTSKSTFCSPSVTGSGGNCVEPVEPGRPMCGGCQQGTRCDNTTKLCVRETNQTCNTPRAGCANSTTYCCPEAKHCLEPGAAPTPCPDGTCADGKTCCPLTKLCVAVHEPCTPICPADSYCCPDALHCLHPTNPGVLCSKDAPCKSNEVCCPLTHECVAVGAPCNP